MPEIKSTAHLVAQLRRNAQYLAKHLADIKAGANRMPDHDVLVDLLADSLLAAQHIEWAGDLDHPGSVPPVMDTSDENFSLQVLGLIDDPLLRWRGQDLPFWDVVAWWPVRKLWTVTHQTRADAEAADYPTNVVRWRPLPPVVMRAGEVAWG